MVGRTSAVLILCAALIAWDETVPRVHPVSEWWRVALVALIVMPATFGITYLALPARKSMLYVVGGVALLGAVIAFSLLGWPVLANLAKLGALTTAGWLFLTLFEELSWAVLIAAIIPFIDAYSVWRGPTKSITEHHASVFTTLSIGFVVPGGSERLGLPDVFFFAVFLAATTRFGLRTFASWLVMLASLGITVVGTTFWVSGGLPALPAIAFGFLAPNADLIWRRLRGGPGIGDRTRVALH